jgi:PqqD family protein of HPr-rel-A system
MLGFIHSNACLMKRVRTDGVLVEPFGHLWAAFSPSCGETALINDESAAILEVLENGPCDTGEICSALAKHIDLDTKSLQEVIEAAWPRLLEAGLVHDQYSIQAPRK